MIMTNEIKYLVNSVKWLYPCVMTSGNSVAIKNRADWLLHLSSYLIKSRLNAEHVFCIDYSFFAEK